MCCERKACRPTARATTFFRWAPTARSGGTSCGRRTGSGAKPRARRRSRGTPSTIRATLSSTCRSTGRSWTRKRSAIPPRRTSASLSSVQIGSSERLPLVATIGKLERVEHQVVERRRRKHQAEVRVPRRHVLRPRRFPPAPGEARSAAPATREGAPPPPKPRRVSSQREDRGPSGREAFRTAASARAEARRRPAFRASQIRWKPPSPFTAAIRPSDRASQQARRASSFFARTSPAGFQSSRCGPQASHAFGWA